VTEGASNAEIWHGAQEMLATQRSELLRQTDHGEHFCGGLIAYDPDHDAHSCTGMCGDVDLVIEECDTCEQER